MKMAKDLYSYDEICNAINLLYDIEDEIKAEGNETSFENITTYLHQMIQGREE